MKINIKRENNVNTSMEMSNQNKIELFKIFSKMDFKFDHSENGKTYVRHNNKIFNMKFSIYLSEPIYGITDDIEHIKNLLKQKNKLYLGEISTYYLEKACSLLRGVTYIRKFEKEKVIGILVKDSGKGKFKKWKNKNFPNENLNLNEWKLKYNEAWKNRYYLCNPVSVIKLLKHEYNLNTNLSLETEYKLGSMGNYIFERIYLIFKTFIKNKWLNQENRQILMSILDELPQKDINSLIKFMDLNFGFSDKLESFKLYLK